MSILNSQFSIFFFTLSLSLSLSLSFNLFVQKRARNKKRTTSARSAFSPAGRVSGDDDDYDVVVVVDDDAIGNVDILGGGFVVIFFLVFHEGFLVLRSREWFV